MAAVEAAEARLRAELRTIIEEAVAAESYTDVAAIARITAALFHLRGEVASDTYLMDGLPKPSVEAVLGSGRRRISEGDSHSTPAADLKTPPRPALRKDQYPVFLRDGVRLLKVAWSKKERAPYEHRAPQAVLEDLISAIQRTKGEGKLFQAGDVMPVKNAQHEDYPSYQSYLALNWLREVGVIRKKGREGYVLKPKAATTEKLAELWAALPALESNE